MAVHPSPIGHPSFRTVSTFILEFGIDAKLSTHAGTFLCNQTFSMGATTENAKYLIGTGLVHTPAHRLHLCGQRDCEHTRRSVPTLVSSQA